MKAKKHRHHKFDYGYTRIQPWRQLSPNAFRIAHMLLDNVDQCGLVAISPSERLHTLIDNPSMRLSHMHDFISEITRSGLAHRYQHARHGDILCFVSYAIQNTSGRFSRASLYTPVPAHILEEFPAYARLFAPEEKGDDNLFPNADTSTASTIEQAVAYWNAFAGEHGMPQVIEISTKRRRHYRARTGEPLFDLAKILAAVLESDWLLGKVTGSHGTRFKLTFDYLIEDNDRYVKILEGKYKSQRASGIAQPGGPVGGKGHFVPDPDYIRNLGRQAQ